MRHRGQSGLPHNVQKIICRARAQLGQVLIEQLIHDFTQNGPEVVAQVREDDPSTYLRIVANLIPRADEFTLSAVDLAEKTDDELQADIVAKISRLLPGYQLVKIEEPDESDVRGTRRQRSTLTGESAATTGKRPTTNPRSNQSH